MFENLIKKAEAAAGEAASKYAIRAAIAVPLLVGAGFLTVAMTLILSERVGPIAACLIVAAAYMAIGAVVAVVASVAHDREVIEAAVVVNDAPGPASEVAQAAMTVAPLALISELLTSVGGPNVALGAARFVGRNLPLVVLAGLIGVLFMPGRKWEAPLADNEFEPVKLNGKGPPGASTQHTSV